MKGDEIRKIVDDNLDGIKHPIASIDMSYTIGGAFVTKRWRGRGWLSPQMLVYLNKAKNGSSVSFDIFIVGPNGKTRKLANRSFAVIIKC